MRGSSTPARTVLVAVAVLCALGVGLALGSGPLGQATTAAVSAGTAGLGADSSGDDRAGAEIFGDTFTEQTASRVYGDRLAGRQVALLTMPGTDGDVADSLAAQIEVAGGAFVARYAVEAALVDAGQKSLVDTLGTQLDEQLPDPMVRGAAPTYVRMGQLLGGAVATRDERAVAPGGPATTVRRSLVGAELLQAPDEDPDLAPWVVVLLPDSGSTGDVDPAILSGLVAGLAGRAAGVVVAADLDSGVAGDLATLRGEPVAQDVTTVDGVDTAAGRAVTVLALARRTQGRGGAFGASGSDGVAPLG